MTAHILRRELGVVIRCNADGCDAKFQTANVVVKHNRAAAKSAGWIRGGRLPGDPDKPDAPRKVSKRPDFCPVHAPAELEALAALAKAKVERSAKRAAESKQRLAAQRVAQGASPSP